MAINNPITWISLFIDEAKVDPHQAWLCYSPLTRRTSRPEQSWPGPLYSVGRLPRHCAPDLEPDKDCANPQSPLWHAWLSDQKTINNHGGSNRQVGTCHTDVTCPFLVHPVSAPEPMTAPRDTFCKMSLGISEGLKQPHLSLV